ncbi:trehalose-phosphatase [Coxiella-like endosymbiont]|nr:trehalose-phosphatase [Coxiella-like endosymbiont]
MRPAVDWHKGKALLHIIELLSYHYARIYPVFIGDDVTDEDAL